MKPRPEGRHAAGEGLSRWERALERWQDGLLSKVRHREHVELVEALHHECDDHAVVCSETRVVVPNAYEVELDTRVHEELMRRGRRDVGEALTDDLARHGERKGYEWAGPLTVRVTPAERPPDEPYRVSSSPMPHVRADAFPAEH
ncbi:FhaA domain-containing protein [Streptomyces sp. NPDC053755]|uniref:FhaA domain-containing protein n=1 Tax=Streptomyces sp. NPDC053755 TaxID=3155815 RepID=UPI00342A0C7D